MQETSEKNDDALTRSKYIGWNYHLAYTYISSALFHCSYFFCFIGFAINLLQSHLFIIEKCWHKKQRGEFGLLCKIKITLVLSGFLAVLALPSSLSIKIPLLLNLLSRLRNHSEKHVKPPFPSSCWEEIHVQGEKKKRNKRKKVLQDLEDLWAIIIKLCVGLVIICSTFEIIFLHKSLKVFPSFLLFT